MLLSETFSIPSLNGQMVDLLHQLPHMLTPCIGRGCFPQDAGQASSKQQTRLLPPTGSARFPLLGKSEDFCIDESNTAPLSMTSCWQAAEAASSSSSFFTVSSGEYRRRDFFLTSCAAVSASATIFRSVKQLELRASCRFRPKMGQFFIFSIFLGLGCLCQTQGTADWPLSPLGLVPRLPAGISTVYKA